MPKVRTKRRGARARSARAARNRGLRGRPHGMMDDRRNPATRILSVRHVPIALLTP
jgi:hypothetical protein